MTADEGLQKLSVLIGQRSLDEHDWEPLEDQPCLGVEFSSESSGAWVGWEIGFAASTDDDNVLGIDFEGTTTELFGGVKKTFGESTAAVRPYVGAGVAVINADLEGEFMGLSASDDDTGVGGYAHGGFFWVVTGTFSVGLDARILAGTDIELFGVEGDADYFQIAFVLGWGL